MNSDVMSAAIPDNHAGCEALPGVHPPLLPELPPIRGWGEVLEALLKRPYHLLAGLTGRNNGYLTRRLAALAFLGMAAYGVVVGLFAGQMQLVAVPVKLAGGLLAAAVICWPSLYILLCLSGGQQSAREVTGLLASALALLVVLMAGFAPVAWIFTQSTHAAGFMGGLHVAFWLVACGFALRRFDAGLAALNRRRLQALPVWGVVFVVVCLQMTTTLRPLLGPFTDWSFAARAFFLQAWFG